MAAVARRLGFITRRVLQCQRCSRDSAIITKSCCRYLIMSKNSSVHQPAFYSSNAILEENLRPKGLIIPDNAEVEETTDDEETMDEDDHELSKIPSNPSPDDEVEEYLKSIRYFASRLKTSMVAMGGTQVLGGIYLWYCQDHHFFVRFAVFTMVVPFSMAAFLPAKSCMTLSNLEGLKSISGFFRRSDLVIGLGALGLLVASMYDIFYPYISKFIVETGDELQKFAKEDMERLRQIFGNKK